MTDPVLSAEIAELADLALVHSVLVEVFDAAAVLQRHPLDDTAATRMQRALDERVPPAKRALTRLQTQQPPPGSVTRGPAALRLVLPSLTGALVPVPVAVRREDRWTRGAVHRAKTSAGGRCGAGDR